MSRARPCPGHRLSRGSRWCRTGRRRRRHLRGAARPVRLARHRIGSRQTAPPSADGTTGRRDPRDESISGRLWGLGRRGFGVDTTRSDHRCGVRCSGTRRTLGRTVDLRSLAVVGAQSGDLQDQIDAGRPAWPDVAVVVVGANDVTHRVPPGRSVALLTAPSRGCRSTASRSSSAPAPTSERSVRSRTRCDGSRAGGAGRWQRHRWSPRCRSRVLAAVALADLLGAEFDAHPDTDVRSRPVPPVAGGYRALAEALVPSLADAVTASRHRTSGYDVARTRRGRRRAAEVGGAEVSADPDRASGRLLRLRRLASAGCPAGRRSNDRQGPLRRQSRSPRSGGATARGTRRIGGLAGPAEEITADHSQLVGGGQEGAGGARRRRLPEPQPPTRQRSWTPRPPGPRPAPCGRAHQGGAQASP